jgi:hypothetical protein
MFCFGWDMIVVLLVYVVFDDEFCSMYFGDVVIAVG